MAPWLILIGYLNTGVQQRNAELDQKLDDLISALTANRNRKCRQSDSGSCLKERHSCYLAVSNLGHAGGSAKSVRPIGVQLWVQQNAPALVERVHHMYSVTIRDQRSTFI